MLFVAPQLRVQVELFQRFEHRLQVGLLLELGLLVHMQFHVGQRLHHTGIAQLPLHFVEDLLILVEAQ